MKKLLVYRWGSLSEPLFCRALENLRWNYTEFAREMTNYHADAAFAKDFMECIHANGIEAAFSYDYFPLISMICEINKIPYISWIYDCPQYTLQSKTLTSNHNYIFCFDKKYAEYLRAMGAVHCYHFPLAGTKEFVKKIEECQLEKKEKFQCDLSFVGNLYNENKNRLGQADLTTYTKGYVEGLIQAQLLVYGYNFLKESLPELVCKEIVQKCGLHLGEEYVMNEKQMAADTIGMEVTRRERELVLSRIAGHYPIRLYTSSELPMALQRDKIEKQGFADYEEEVPFIFQYSKINLNITSKTIESGIPQRIFDILSSGGFCITNYQSEIAEYFVDGQELVMYSDMTDLINKIEYYLEHEEERTQIAKNGCRKVMENFELEEKVSNMLKIVEENTTDS